MTGKILELNYLIYKTDFLKVHKNVHKAFLFLQKFKIAKNRAPQPIIIRNVVPQKPNTLISIVFLIFIPKIPATKAPIPTAKLPIDK